MARKRQIDPDIWTSVQFTNLEELGARILFIAMFSNADDEGRLRAHPAYLKMIAFPRDDYSQDIILNWRNQIAAQCLIQVYSNGSNPDEYLILPTFSKHQTINKRYPSKLPSPPTTTPLPNPYGTTTTPLPYKDGMSKVQLPGKSGVGLVSVSGMGMESDMVSDSASESESGMESGAVRPGVIHKKEDNFVDNSPRPTDPTESEPTLDKEKSTDDLEPIEDYIKRLYKEFFGELEVTPKTIPKIEAAITGISQYSDDEIARAFGKVAKRRPPPKYPLGYVLKTLRSR